MHKCQLKFLYKINYSNIYSKIFLKQIIIVIISNIFIIVFVNYCTEKQIGHQYLYQFGTQLDIIFN